MFKSNKNNYAFRLQSIEAVILRNLTVKKEAIEKGIEASILRLWLSSYEKYGKAGLNPRVRQQYEKVINTIDQEFLSLCAASIRFNIPSESVIIC
jgi:transposase-like protein